MKKNSIFYFLLWCCVFTLFLLKDSAAQTRSDYGISAGVALPVGSFASSDILSDDPLDPSYIDFRNGASVGVAASFRYTYYWDGIFTEKDALGIYAEVGVIWNPVNKSIKDLLETNYQYLNYHLNLGPSFSYYLGKSEEFSLYGELGVIVGSSTLMKSSRSLGMGIGATAGFGIDYMERVRIGMHYHFLGMMKIGDTDEKITPHILQLRIGVHF